MPVRVRTPSSLMRFAVLLLPFLVISGCGPLYGLRTARDNAADIAARHGFQRDFWPAGPFTITVFHRGLTERRGILRVYIESDGRAWTRAGRIASDPTPGNPLALKLAVQDPSPAVLYIARPCQFTQPADARSCHPKYWASHRFAPEVIGALDQVIDAALARARGGPRDGPQVELVGYSGGGSLAALIAARRGDVHWLLTLAANLDHQAWTAYHGVSAMSGSMNARDVAPELATLPQLHLVGDNDSVVPQSIIASYQAVAGPAARFQVIKGYSHTCCWEQDWKQLLCRSGLPGVTPCAGWERRD